MLKLGLLRSSQKPEEEEDEDVASPHRFAASPLARSETPFL
jgi:hypothetical protein